jgi:hypothetical protein
MGFLDKLKLKATEVKEKAVEAVDEHGPQIKGGIEKAGTFVDKKTKGKYSDKIAKGTQKAEAAIDKIDKDGDAKPAAGQPTPPPTAGQPTPPPAPGPGHPPGPEAHGPGPEAHGPGPEAHGPGHHDHDHGPGHEGHDHPHPPTPTP